MHPQSQYYCLATLQNKSLLVLVVHKKLQMDAELEMLLQQTSQLWLHLDMALF